MHRRFSPVFGAFIFDEGEVLIEDDSVLTGERDEAAAGIKMPVVYKRQFGKGRVFYDALGHTAKLVESEPNLTIMRRGFKWADRNEG